MSDTKSVHMYTRTHVNTVSPLCHYPRDWVTETVNMLPHTEKSMVLLYPCNSSPANIMRQIKRLCLGTIDRQKTKRSFKCNKGGKPTCVNKGTLRSFIMSKCDCTPSMNPMPSFMQKAGGKADSVCQGGVQYTPANPPPLLNLSTTQPRQHQVCEAGVGQLLRSRWAGLCMLTCKTWTDARWQRRRRVLKKLGENQTARWHHNKWDVKFLEQCGYCWESAAGGFMLHSLCIAAVYSWNRGKVQNLHTLLSGSSFLLLIRRSHSRKITLCFNISLQRRSSCAGVLSVQL